jgi:RNA polymerase sigma factor (sigma-70 family)
MNTQLSPGTVFSSTGIENLEASSALARASRGGLLARRSPLLRFEPDERLVKLIRVGHDSAFEALFNRYNSRLLSFCTSMLKSRQDAEDVLQEVFANAHAAMLRDERAINVRPWLYRIARNRCLNHLRRPVPEGQDSMDIHPHQNGTTTAEQVQDREELRQVLADVRTLPETQRTALLLREIDQLSYEEIAQAMDTTVPSVKSLLVRARMGLAESSKARLLTCGEVQVELAEAAEGIAKASGPARKHVRSCDGCREFRNQLRADRKALAALFPFGPLALLKGGLLSKVFGGSAASSSSVGAGTAGSVGGASAAGGFSVIGSAIGIKAAAGMATAALLTAGAVEVRNFSDNSAPAPNSRDSAALVTPPATGGPAARSDVAEFTAAPTAKADRAPAQADPPQAAPADGQQRPTTPVDEPAATEPATIPVDPGTATIGGVGEVPTTSEVNDGQDPGSAPATPPTETSPVQSGPPTAEPTPATPVPPVVVSPAPVAPAVPAAPAPAPPPPPTPVDPEEHGPET